VLPQSQAFIKALHSFIVDYHASSRGVKPPPLQLTPVATAASPLMVLHEHPAVALHSALPALDSHVFIALHMLLRSFALCSCCMMCGVLLNYCCGAGASVLLRAARAKRMKNVYRIVPKACYLFNTCALVLHSHCPVHYPHWHLDMLFGQ
jgi:hypothetical protein